MEHKAAAKGQKSLAPKRSFNLARSVTYAGTPTHPLVHPRAKLSSHRVGQFLQPKLTIGSPNDKYEQEADRVADQVMRMPEPQHGFPCGGGCPKCQKEQVDQEHERLQTKHVQTSDTGQIEVQSIVNEVLRSPGQPLESGIREFMELRFGHDFSKVRVHSDTKAAISAHAVNAESYTYGRDIVFGASHYAPGTTKGNRLLAHELTHTLQQARGYNKLASPFAQQTAAGPTGMIRCKPAAHPARGYKNCDWSTTLVTSPNQRLESARQRAIDYVQVTIRDLARAPSSKRSTRSYRQALQRHFLSPTADQRQVIRENYREILIVLKNPSIFVCDTIDQCNEPRERDEPRLLAYYGRSTDKLIHVCPLFFHEGRNCRAISLIHEAAHAIGIGIGTIHPPYRGSRRNPSVGEHSTELSPYKDWARAIPYPIGGKAPPYGEDAANRVKNPDAYSYFAAHVWRETDIGRKCYGGRMIGGVYRALPEVLVVED